MMVPPFGSPIGRFAPSPTGRLHLGNLRTALRAYESSVVSGSGRFVIRMEDLDLATSSKEWAKIQLLDLENLGVRSDVDVVYQSDRFGLYTEVLNFLTERGRTFECFCTRKEVREAVTAPHGLVVGYPGTCRDLTPRDQEARRRDRPAAVRLRVDEASLRQGRAQEIVLRRNDGVPAYNLAVVVDDELQGITEVVRGEDLVSVTGSQRYLQSLLGFRRLRYEHLPLVVGPDGERLSKRHGGITLEDCFTMGFTADEVSRALLNSLRVGSNGWNAGETPSDWLVSQL